MKLETIINTMCLRVLGIVYTQAQGFDISRPVCEYTALYTQILKLVVSLHNGFDTGLTEKGELL